jgi:isochorismate synthase
MLSWNLLVDTFISHALEHQEAFAIWSSPKSKEWHLASDNQSILYNHLSEINHLEGFLIHPYSIDLPGIFIHQKNYACYSEIEGIINATGLFASLNTSLDLKETFVNCLPNATDSDMHQEDYVSKVRELLTALENQSVEKVVLSRFETVYTKVIPDLANIIKELRNTQVNSFVSLVYHPSIGLWLGSTPEVLLSENEQGIFYTMSLAGTQPYTEDKDISDVAWTQKEIEEQAYVSRYIIDCFKHIRLREYKEIGPRTIQSGNLLHLKTDFTVDTQAINRTKLTNELLPLLHPTSAVCGMPKEKAIEYIEKIEQYNRKIFTGYIGPKTKDSISLYVNLRCAEIFSDAIRYYAGAGITIDSNPEKEYIETQLKMSLLKQIFNNHPLTNATRASTI